MTLTAKTSTGEPLTVEIPASAFVLPGGMMALDHWLDSVGISKCLFRKWVSLGWIKAEYITGRQYVMQESVQQFLKMIQSGDLKGTINIPPKGRKDDQP